MYTKHKFSNQQSAIDFAKKVNGKVNDLRNVKGAKSKFTVTFIQKESKYSWSPEDGRDFGYSNEFWN